MIDRGGQSTGSNDESITLTSGGPEPTPTPSVAPTPIPTPTATPSSGLEIDALARNAGESDYVGDGIYNSTGEGQTKAQLATPDTPASYEVKVENDGTSPTAVQVTGPLGQPG